jgi:DNA-binding response OmpR family regulator
MSTHTILIAEDDDGDYFILQRALLKAQFTNPVHRVTNGQEAVDYLVGANPYSDRMKYPMPTLLLLDLKMPIKHGFDVLRWIRQEAPTPTGLLPTIIFSSTSRTEDVDLGFKLGANGFLTKPTTMVAMVETIRAIDAYWIKLNCRGSC